MTNLTVATVGNTETAHTLDQDIRATSFRQSYHEIADQHVMEVDVLEQLRGNLAQLEDLHGRLRFAMTEISYLMKKRN